MVRWEGLEPPTYWFVASHSIQLSYQRISHFLDCLCIISYLLKKIKCFFKKIKIIFKNQVNVSSTEISKNKAEKGYRSNEEKAF